MQVVAKVSHVPKRDSFHNEKLSIGLAEPNSELSQVIADCFSRVVRKVVTSEVARH